MNYNDYFKVAVLGADWIDLQIDYCIKITITD